ncbi:hypothetical protein LLEC1_00721 [Akanthomyces lecanii]|uniref:Uncharacterized protein n=1 Tax=Cordyceps confragosa TaxID=2714763 RepID=A0A179IDI6_CORDF|nr:hypothetical protein LLEC1_00721 [Akanthomyces lecanii]
MDCLKVPEAGLLLQGPHGQDTPLPPQAFALSLGGSTVESLIRAARNGTSIELALGKTPTLHYGSESHRIARPHASSPYDLYLTRPFESYRVAARLPVTTTLFTKPTPSKAKQKTSSLGKGTGSGLDSDIEALQSGLAAHEAAKERTQMIERAPNAGKSGKAKNKLLSGYNAVPRSIATSPSHNPSPATTPAPSAAKQAVERAKEQRLLLVHELAAGEKSIEYLRQKWQGRPDDFESTLKKVAEYRSETESWSMKKPYWKELDVWNYDYANQEERQIAIENAIRQFDKQRLSAFEPEWQKLLRKEERNKGKCLSRLQAALAKGPTQPAPKIKVQRVDDSSTSKDDGDSHSLGSDRSRAGGESMSRTNSTGSVTKPRKSVKEPGPKRAVPATKSKPAMPKPSSTKPKTAGTKTNGGRVLSKEIIDNSDSSGDEALVAKSRPKPKPAADTAPPPHQVAKPSAKPAPKPAAKPAPKPVAKPAAKPAPVKRPHYDDDESSSSSGTPLAKRLKQKAPPQNGSKLKDRAPVLTKSSRPTPKTIPTKSKNTSPIKSSPLATSPPTNASDMESDHRVTIKKRKVELDSRAGATKYRATERGRQEVSQDLLEKATEFHSYYEKYANLHYQMEALAHPPQEKVENLVNMRHKLEAMKREIYGRA